MQHKIEQTCKHEQSTQVARSQIQTFTAGDFKLTARKYSCYAGRKFITIETLYTYMYMMREDILNYTLDVIHALRY